MNYNRIQCLAAAGVIFFLAGLATLSGDIHNLYLGIAVRMFSECILQLFSTK